VVQGNGLPLTGNMQLKLPEARIASRLESVIGCTSYDSLLSTYTDFAAHRLCDNEISQKPRLQASHVIAK